MNLYETLQVNYNGDKINFVDNQSYESRNKAMMKLITTSWEKHIKGSDKNNTSFILYTGDRYNERFDYSFSIRDISQSNKYFPCFIFENWPEIGIIDYQQVYNDMIISSKKPYTDDRVFWIGCNSNYNRTMGCNVAKQNVDLANFIMMEWQRIDNDALHLHTPEYVSLPDHCNYRVLIDFGGNGFSGRLPLLLASGRPVIIVGHPEEQLFYWDEENFIPWVHFIPCGKKDGSDVTEGAILESLLWTFENKNTCKEIGKNGQEYAMKYFNKNHIIDKIGEILKNHK
jgi:hypothetical protein